MRYNSTVFIQDYKVGFLNKFGMKNSGALVFKPVSSFLTAEIAYLLDDNKQSNTLYNMTFYAHKHYNSIMLA